MQRTKLVLEKLQLIKGFQSFAVRYFDIPKNECEVRNKLREKFMKHANVTDIRIIDMLVIKVCFHYWRILKSSKVR